MELPNMEGTIKPYSSMYFAIEIQYLTVTDSVGRISVRRREHPEVTADDKESRKEDRI